jgi:hypothetical protein
MLLSWALGKDAEGRLRLMRKSRAQETASPAPRASERGASPAAGTKYPRPKILVIDAPDVTPVLHQRGYAAVSGSFGQPVVVPSGGGYQPLNRTADLPGYTEQEIIVVDLAGPDPQKPAGRSSPTPGRRWMPPTMASRGISGSRTTSRTAVSHALSSRPHDHRAVGEPGDEQVRRSGRRDHLP